MSKFKKGDRVMVGFTYRADEEAGLSGGTLGVVRRVLDDGDLEVRFGGFEPPARLAVDGGGWRMSEEQLELVDDGKLEDVATPAAAPVYVLTNAELQTAIDRAHAMVQSTSRETTTEHRLRDHLEHLLRVQQSRATKESAA